MKKIITTLLILMMVTSLMGCGAKIQSETTSNTDIPKEYEKIVGMLDNTKGYKMPYFGGYSLDDKQIVIFNLENDKAVVWNNKKSGNTKVIDLKDIPEDKKLGFYTEGKFNGIKTVFVMNEDADTTFNFAVHEGYHFYGQKWLSNLETDEMAPRGTIYLENIVTRNLLNQANNKLCAHLDGKNGDAAKEAAYFYKKLMNEKSDIKENMGTIAAEGSANFVEMLFRAVATNPEIKDDPVKVAKAAYELDNKMKNGNFYDKGLEYYKVTSTPMYYFIINGQEKLVDELMKGKHPLQTLAENIKLKECKEDEKLAKEITTFYEAVNKTSEKSVQAYNNQKDSRDFVEINVPNDMFPGSMEFGEFINYKVEDKYVTINTRTKANALIKDGKLELKGINTYSNDYKYYTMYVPKDKVFYDKGMLNIKTDEINIENVKADFKDNKYYVK